MQSLTLAATIDDVIKGQPITAFLNSARFLPTPIDTKSIALQSGELAGYSSDNWCGPLVRVPIRALDPIGSVTIQIWCPPENRGATLTMRIPKKQVGSVSLQPGEASRATFDLTIDKGAELDVELLCDRFVPPDQHDKRERAYILVGLTFARYETVPLGPADLIRQAATAALLLADDSSARSITIPLRALAPVAGAMLSVWCPPRALNATLIAYLNGGLACSQQLASGSVNAIALDITLSTNQEGTLQIDCNEPIEVGPKDPQGRSCVLVDLRFHRPALLPIEPLGRVKQTSVANEYFADGWCGSSLAIPLQALEATSSAAIVLWCPLENDNAVLMATVGGRMVGAAKLRAGDYNNIPLDLRLAENDYATLQLTCDSAVSLGPPDERRVSYRIMSITFVPERLPVVGSSWTDDAWPTVSLGDGTL